MCALPENVPPRLKSTWLPCIHGGEVEVERAVTIEVDQRHVADAPGLHRREVDLLELEPTAEVRVEEHAERAADRDVGPSIVVHVSGGERTEVHGPGSIVS